MLLGMNGSGKGVLSKGLKRIGVHHVSCSGALEKIKERYPDWQQEIDLCCARGLYVPDQIIIPVIDQIFVDFGDNVPRNLSIDGGVRTKEQGERYCHYLRQAGHRIIAVHVDADENICLERSLARMRVDDTPEIIRVRFGQYRTYTVPAIKWLKRKAGKGIEFVTIEDGTLEEKFTTLFSLIGMQSRANEIAALVEAEITAKK